MKKSYILPIFVVLILGSLFLAFYHQTHQSVTTKTSQSCSNSGNKTVAFMNGCEYITYLNGTIVNETIFPTPSCNVNSNVTAFISDPAANAILNLTKITPNTS